MNPSLRHVLLALVWLACAVLIAFGSAGLVAGLTHEPGTPAREELTWAADEAIRPELAAASSELAAISGDVDELGRLGRIALASLVGRNLEGLAAAIADGQALAASIEAAAGSLGARLAGLPGVGSGEEARLAPDMRAQHEALVKALTDTAGLRESWATLTAGSAAASRLATLLADHDTYAAEATKLGSRGSYSPALTHLGRAEAALKEAKTLRDALANTVDVTVLDEWLARNGNLDAALRRLYTALRESKGTVTAEVREAAAAERAAQLRLPPDTRGLVVIMAEVARGGLNQAVIGIERAKGKLAAAVEEIGRSDSENGGSGGAATPGP